MEPLIVILGPTATGKTSLGIRLAREIDGEIVNADALQVYRGLDIGTAKPSPAERAAAPHHLIDILEPEESYSAGEFVRRARPVISEIRSRGHLAIVVGGSGLYLRALLEGLSPIPAADPEVRRSLEGRCAREGLGALYRELAEVDPETAGRLAPRDRQRVLRALEVAASSGRTLASWIRRPPSAAERSLAVKVGLTLPRAILYDRIAERVREMLDRGWVEEVAALLRQGVEPDVPAFQAIGYSQVVRHLEGDWSLETALEETIRATRRYAKRQMTWFRKEKDVHWIEASDPERSMAPVLRRLDLEVQRLDEQA